MQRSSYYTSSRWDLWQLRSHHRMSFVGFRYEGSHHTALVSCKLAKEIRSYFRQRSSFRIYHPPLLAHFHLKYFVLFSVFHRGSTCMNLGDSRRLVIYAYQTWQGVHCQSKVQQWWRRKERQPSSKDPCRKSSCCRLQQLLMRRFQHRYIHIRQKQPKPALNPLREAMKQLSLPHVRYYPQWLGNWRSHFRNRPE